MGRLRLITAAALFALAALPVSALADSNRITVFPVPSEPLDMGGIAVDSNGDLWFTESSGQGAIGRITPQGTITEFPLSSSGSPGSIVLGPDGDLWFGETGRFKEVGNQAIGKITPDGRISEFPLADRNYFSGLALAAGSDGNVWFTAGSAIGKIAPSGQITEFALQSNSIAEQIAAGPGGDMWFTELTPNPDWPSAGKLGQITPGGQVAEFPLPPKIFGESLFMGPDKKLYLTYGLGHWSKYGFGVEANQLGVIDSSGAVVEERSGLPCRGCKMIVGPDGNFWFASGRQVGRLSLDGQLTVFDLPQGVSAYAITSGPDGNLWFTGKRFLKPHITGLIGRFPPSLLEVKLEGEWWNLRAEGRWTHVSLACVGGSSENELCQGTLQLTTEVGGGETGTPASTVTLAQRPYRLGAGSEHEFALRLSRKALGVRIGHTNLHDVQVTATAGGGQDAEYSFAVLERSPRHRQHRGRRHSHHRR